MADGTDEAPTGAVTITPDMAAELDEARIRRIVEQQGLDAEGERRLRQAQVYRGGDLHVLHDSGAITLRPQGPRLLIRAILSQDASDLGMGVAYDARQAVAHEVVAVGHGVDRWLDERGVPDDARDDRGVLQRIRAWSSGRGAAPCARPRPGDHVFLVSTAADRASKTDKACRLWLVHVEDVSAAWQLD